MELCTDDLERRTTKINTDSERGLYHDIKIYVSFELGTGICNCCEPSSAQCDCLTCRHYLLHF